MEGFSVDYPHGLTYDDQNGHLDHGPAWDVTILKTASIRHPAVA
jgi:hypothetical protein